MKYKVEMEVSFVIGYIVFALIIGLCVVAFIGFKHSGKRKYQNRNEPLQENYDLKAIDITDIDKMEDGSEFEMYLYRLLIELGYSGVYKTTNSRDFGADVVFTDREGIRNVVQAKRYTDPVGISAVQEVFSCMRYYKAKKAIVPLSA